MEFKNKTNWCAITGAPSSGKTSVINALAELGYPIQNEVARELIEACLKQGQSLAQARSDPRGLQKNILALKLEREQKLDMNELIFMDRGMPDSLSYFRLAGLDIKEAMETCYLFQYRAVFIFDRLPFVSDGIRSEDDTLADKIDIMLEEDYKMIGYTPIRVPVMSIADRTDFVLKQVSAT
jgi:predicted ATPase